MRRLYFEFIVSFIKKKNIYGVSNWVNNFEKRLSDYLNVRKQINKGKLHPKICRNINYILDIINEGIFLLRATNSVKWINYIDTTAKKLLDKDVSLECIRDIHTVNGDDIYYRKIMDDICTDIIYIKQNMGEIRKSNNCQKIVSSIEDKKDYFLKKNEHKINNKFFQLKNGCTIEKIKNEFPSLDCNELIEPSKESLVEERVPAPVEAGEGVSVRAAEDELTETTLEDAQAAQNLDTLLEQSLQEETPNFDTTYAAASLTGVSLFGVLLYKVMYNCKNEYYYLLMNNFEYLQTGIPNQQYHLAYNSIPN
ncbi:Pv-fam-c protein [Plasmodium vivax]|uniref:Pv-fam-c protein n=1 Tax=Plasmodium vivax (strain Salvador I) TaxID=126793 RepID=A5KCQ9_PLAVS|nr:Pv-fam-c protein [Plasmodium vivax]EDL42863.1 Pv-fam-c protein [Plasmodium vivax]|eukprot:XP_001612637.1 Pv-fam-c protein [Plasmodium vivax Sal-1]